MKRIFLVVGGLAIAILIPMFAVQGAPSLDANCVGVITVPTVIRAGDRFQATAQVKNNGINTWVKSQSFFLGSQDPQDNGRWGVGRIPLPVASIAPKQTATFKMFVTAPHVPGKYSFVWQMLQENRTWFGQKCKTKNPITVLPRIATPTPVPTITLVPTPTITPVITPTPTIVPTSTPTATPIITPTPTATPTVTPTATPFPTVTPRPYDSISPTPSTAFTAVISSPVANTTFTQGQNIAVAVSGFGTPVCGTWKLVKPSGETIILTGSNFGAGQLPGNVPSCQTNPY